MKTKLLLLVLVLFGLKLHAQNQAAFLNGLETINITTNSVTFKYNVRTNGSVTNCSVWYSLSSNWALPVVGITPSASYSQNANYQAGVANVGGLQPNTTYYWRIVANNNAGNADSSTLSFTTLPLPTVAPAITNISVANASNSATIAYTLNGNNGATTSIVKYGLTSGNLSSQIAGFSYNGIASAPGTAVLTGLVPLTQYFYKIEATNSIGTTSSVVMNFTTSDLTIIQYDFDNTRANIVGTEPFSIANTTFTANRNNVANTALSISANATGTNATITNLPEGNSVRTISFWYKVATNAGNTAIFHQGDAGTGTRIGMYIQNTGRPVFWADIPNPEFGTSSFTANTWHHAVIKYDGTNVSLYMNSVLQGTKAYTANTTANAPLTFLNTGTTLSIDDLKIYNYPISQTEVTNLYTNNTLESRDFNQNNLEVLLYPNPTNDVLNIEIANEIKSVEIYNIQGQKVKVANQKQINVSELSSGIYMIKIQDTDNAVSTKKFMKQ